MPGLFSLVASEAFVKDGPTGGIKELKELARRGIRVGLPLHSFQQSTVAQQSGVPAQISALRGRRAISAPGSKTYVSTAAAAAWAFCQDGTGSTIINIFVPRDLASTHVICGTTSTGAAGGITHYTTALAAATAGVYAAGVVAVAGPGSAGTVSQDVATYTDLSHATAASPQYQFRLKASVGSSGAYAASADSTPQHTMRLWSNTPPNHPLTIRINQSNGGGHAVTLSGATWVAGSRYSSAGNANGTICTLTVVRRTDGYTWLDAFQSYTAI